MWIARDRDAIFPRCITDACSWPGHSNFVPSAWSCPTHGEHSGSQGWKAGPKSKTREKRKAIFFADSFLESIVQASRFRRLHRCSVRFCHSPYFASVRERSGQFCLISRCPRQTQINTFKFNAPCKRHGQWSRKFNQPGQFLRRLKIPRPQKSFHSDEIQKCCVTICHSRSNQKVNVNSRKLYPLMQQTHSSFFWATPNLCQVLSQIC